jgi:NSS family neurotransmitter:Na+ symporter
MEHNMIGRAQWSSFSSYILVTTGAVVGLGNIFQFPYLVNKFGGLFLAFYILFELLISIPLLLAELTIGLRGRQNPVGAISIIARESGANNYWRMIGWLCFLILFLTLSYYIVAVTLPLDKFLDTAKTLIIGGVHAQSIADVPLEGHRGALEVSFIFFLVMTLLVIARGINRGLEGISWIIVPTYLIILVGLAIYTSVYGNFSGAFFHLFYVPANQAVLPVIFAALIYAFFKLNVGMGSMIVYGSYLPYTVSLGKSTLVVVCLDALVSLLSYFIMNAGGGLTVPVENNLAFFRDTIAIFSGMPNGLVIAALLFFAAVIAAWTATIAMAESATVILIERFDLSRLHATGIFGLGVWILGTLIIFSTQMDLSHQIEKIAATFMTPISAFLIAIFAGWIVKTSITSSELGFKSGLYVTWLFLVRFVAPLAIVYLMAEVWM